MSSTIRINRICAFCQKEFVARTSVTQYCGDTCAKRAYKARQRASKIEISNVQTLKTKLEQLQSKPFLKPREVALLLNCSIRSVYNHIQAGNIKATNVGERLTRIRKEDFDEIFNRLKQ